MSFLQLFGKGKSRPRATDEGLLYPRVRLSYEEFQEARLNPREPTIYAIEWDGIEYNFLINRRKRSDRAVILGSGDFDRDRIKAPYFARHSWAELIDANAIWYFDPDCLSGEATLSWCYGTNAEWRLERIAALLRTVLSRWNIRRELFFGSSGGGFTSIALACLARSRALAINPQLICLNFWPGIVQKFRESRLAPGEEPIEERLNIARLIEAEKFCPRVTIWQNIMGKRDMDTQITPFVEALRKSSLEALPVRLEFYTHPAGHKFMPSRRDCLDAIRRELEE